MMRCAQPLYAALKTADHKTSAYIIYGMHEAMDENGVLDFGDDYDDLFGGLLGDLADILKCSPHLFTKEEFDKYSEIVDLED